MMSDKCVYLGVSNLVPNAFIELMKVNSTITSIPMDIIKKYGEAVKEKIISDGGKAILFLGGEDTDYFCKHYSSYFTLVYIDNKLYFLLNDDVSISSLIERFRTYISFDELKVFMDEDVVNKGLIKLVEKEEKFTKVKKYE